MVAYQEMPLMREGYKPPSAGHIAGPIKQMKQYTQQQSKEAEISRMKQHTRCAMVLKKYPKFDRYQAAKLLKLEAEDVRRSLSYWLKLGLIKHTGEFGKNRCFIWESAK
jgi:predicted HTH transcriptional regulator